jgi:hypothetical protein
MPCLHAVSAQPLATVKLPMEPAELMEPAVPAVQSNQAATCRGPPTSNIEGLAAANTADPNRKQAAVNRFVSTRRRRLGSACP